MHGCYITNKSLLSDSRFGLITLPQPSGMQTVNNNQAHASYQTVISQGLGESYCSFHTDVVQQTHGVW